MFSLIQYIYFSITELLGILEPIRKVFKSLSCFVVSGERNTPDAVELDQLTNIYNKDNNNINSNPSPQEHNTVQCQQGFGVSTSVSV